MRLVEGEAVREMLGRKEAVTESKRREVWILKLVGLGGDLFALVMMTAMVV